MTTRLPVALAFITFAGPAAADQTSWTHFHGDLASTKFANVESFTPESVSRLERAWEVRTGDVSDGSGERPASVWSATPVYANDTVYLATPFYRVLALEPATGEEKWSYDSRSTLEALTQPALKTRGVAYWESGDDGPCEKRVYLGTMDAHLHALDANTGELCSDFGDGGVLNVNQWNTQTPVWPLSLLQQPTVAGDRLFIGWSGMDWEYTATPPGNLMAVDARTGELLWDTGFIPEELIPVTGTANIWTAMSADPELGLIYAPISAPEPNYWGGNRGDGIPLATSVTALDMETGEIVWSRQLIYHDLWDYDTPSAPTLVDIERDGQVIPALVQTTKQAMIWVLDRRTGEPLFPVEERPVPPSDIDSENASPVQPFAEMPPPTLDYTEFPGPWWVADLVSAGQCSRDLETFRYEGIYTPPSLEGTLFYPGTAGANNWGGAAVDPRTNTLYVNTSRVVQVIRLIPNDRFEDEVRQATGGDLQGGSDEGFHPQRGSPYGIEIYEWLNWAGLPCWAPPYGTFSAYNLNTGERLYEVPFGLSQQWGFYGLAAWGSPTLGGPVVTAGGVVFIGASMDSRVRALDAASGKEVWSDLLAAPVVANPAVYTHEGVDYVVFVAGGNSILKEEVADQVVAYRLAD
ncbi:PQQ-binding-like beta-propeller repeat protein [Chelativorans sp. Marseille-P2723]|uniref:outer membrane protein assembly factor BamB family protein n=1 Tax=Chelativorans sp. Marseille-P2723 TaxID=2709133 RepID=UPI00156EC737|nr:PQQ-binding-like beta-propeller repeat protein [Chelativorans sp. Marseille-P2723]